MSEVQTINLGGERYVIMPEEEFLRLRDKAEMPALPAADERGTRPALESSRAVLARTLIRQREAAGLTQAELARRARVRPETISRLESGKHSATVATVERIDRVLKQGQKKTQGPR